MTITFPMVVFWLGSMATMLLALRAWQKWTTPGMGRWVAPRATLLALAVLVASVAPTGYQEYRARAVQRDYVRVLASFYEFTAAEGVTNVLPGQPGRGQWWGIPYGYKDQDGKAANGILLTTGKDSQGKQVWLRIQ